MYILVVKTSSLGDIIHALPGLTDLQRYYPNTEIHWVAEKSFADVPSWHPSVKRVIPVALRRWRKRPFSAQTRQEWRAFKKELRSFPYDLVIDAQGLMKSAFITRKAFGVHCGLDWSSAWEPLASLCYQKKVSVDPGLHAVERMRRLFGQLLDYQPEAGLPDYGIDRSQFKTSIILPNQPFVVFCHGTTWPTKLYPDAYWLVLAKRCQEQGLHVLLPWGNAEEKKRAALIADQVEMASVLPKVTLTDIAGVISQAQAVVAVDTGLAHVAAALGVPTVSVYGPTNPDETGALGERQIHLAADFPCAPCQSASCQFKGASEVTPACFATIKPELVWQSLSSLLVNNSQTDGLVL